MLLSLINHKRAGYMDNTLPPQSTSSLVTWLHYLEHLHPKAIDPGLERISEVAARCELLTPAPTVFTVAGTNGKGTTCRMLEAILIAAGYRVGVFSSPHLLRYTERVRIQGNELSESDHTAAFSVIEAGRGEISLTYFEFGALAALQLFKQSGLDIVILEVGLGGRLDATNIIDPDVAVITSIALDHTEWLGPDRESIGREKAGIFRKNKPAIVGEPEMPATIAQVAQQKGAELLRHGHEWSYYLQADSWTFEQQSYVLSSLPLPQIPLPNAATALAALYASGLTVSQEAIRKGLTDAILPGRFQIIDRCPRVILDVAHNPHAASYLAERLSALPRKGKVLAIVAMLHDKDINGTLHNLQPQVDQWFCASLDCPRGASAEQLTAYLPAASAFCDVPTAWKAAHGEAKPEDVLLVCGSFHTVAKIMEMIEAERCSGK